MRHSPGDKFGCFTLIEHFHKGRWVAECSCGNQQISHPNRLKESCAECRRKRCRVCGSSPVARKGKCVSCVREWEKTNREKRATDPKRLHDKGKTSAKLRGLEWDLTVGDVERLVTQPCVFCGFTPSEDERVGIDRVDSSGGYTRDNVQSCCFACNQMKWNRTEAEFLEHVARICKHKGL